MAKINTTVAKDKPCPEQQINSHSHNFECDKMQGHPGPHRDKKTGTMWRYPEKIAYGMRHIPHAPLSGGNAGFGHWFAAHCRKCCKNPNGAVHFHKPGQTCGGEFRTNLEKDPRCSRCGSLVAEAA